MVVHVSVVDVIMLLVLAVTISTIVFMVTILYTVGLYIIIEMNMIWGNN